MNLQVHNLYAYYGKAEVLHGVDIHVKEGETTAILGANGAGKTTLLRAICGLVRTSGEVIHGSSRIIGMRPDSIARLGLVMVPQGRGTFSGLSVEDNLKIGAFTRHSKKQVSEDLERVYEYFQPLAARKRQVADQMSGGEQQMLAIGRALMMRPKTLLLDEPSLGLAPLAIRALYDAIQAISKEQSLTVLLVEQNADQALKLAKQMYVLEAGTVVMKEEVSEMSAKEALRVAYLGR